MNILNEAKRLYAFGFAIHWLRHKSKMPVKAGWTTGPRDSLKTLKREYKDEYNIGVRLGTASKLSCGNYLGVIDCDVKSTKKEHLDELNKSLKKLFTGDAPIVFSGRGNGSRHIYVKSKTPQTPFKFAQSKVKVKVLMPSSKPSRIELEKLSSDDIKRGLRLRAAWEVSVMGEGQQVVLPPSIHPDSGDPYRWGSELQDAQDIPLVNFKAPTEKKSFEDLDSFIPEEVDLYLSDLDDDMIELIVDGRNCKDRSASMFKAAMAMERAGFTKHQVLSVLTDRENYLGGTGYDHAKTESRMRAAKWVYKYTYKKAKARATFEEEFSEEVEFETLEPEKIEAQGQELIDDNWRSKLVRQSGPKSPPTNSFFNIKLILNNMVDIHPFLGRNEFTAEDIWLSDTPWGCIRGKTVTDSDSILIKDWLVQNFRVECSTNKIDEVLIKLSLQNSFHPVRAFLDGLRWDGTPRLYNWLDDYLGAEGPERYLQLVGSKTLIAMVKRIYEPGCKFDNVLILEGAQGVGKSTTARILADPWFSDSDLNIGDKDAIVSMQGIWVYELGELSAMSRADTNHLKHFLSRSIDKIRPPFGKRLVSFPRQCVFIGTTNNDEYLKDKTGNRRYWPVKVNQVDMARLEEDRDQLLAEAVEEYMLGVDTWVKNRADLKLIEAEQGLRVESDDITSELAEFMNDSEALNLGDEFRLNDLLKVFPGAVGIKNDRLLQLRMGNALRELGYEKKNKMISGVQSKVWIKKGSGF